MRILDKIFGNYTIASSNQHTVFYDKYGVLNGGLWVIFRPYYKIKLEKLCFLILPSTVVGDIMIAINRTVTEDYVLRSRHIVGIAIACNKEPKDYRKHIVDYFANIQHKYGTIQSNTPIYLNLMERMSGCTLRFVDTLTMTKQGIRKRGDEMTNKEIPTEVIAVYRGDSRTVASEAQRKRPDNHQDVVARNTTKTVQTDQTKPGSGCQGCE